MREMLLVGLDFIKRVYDQDDSLVTVIIRTKVILDLLFSIKDQAELLANGVLGMGDIVKPETRAQCVLDSIQELREKWYVL